MLRRDLQSRRPLDYKSSGSVNRPERRLGICGQVWCHMGTVHPLVLSPRTLP